MSDIHDLYRRKLTTPENALDGLPRRATVLLGFFAAQPPSLVQALADRARAGNFDEVRIYYMHPTPHTAETLLRLDLMDVIKPHPFYMGPGERALTRQATEAGRKVVYFTPASFSDVPRIIREQIVPDVFLLQVAPMDRAGWFSFGLTGAYSLAGLERTKRLIVEVNANLPRSHGTGMVHLAEREEKGASIKDMQYRISGSLFTPPVMPKRIGIEKHGDDFALFISVKGEPMHEFGPAIHLHFDGPFYVGIGFCSHYPVTVDTGVVSNVVLENSAGKMQ